MVVVVESEVCIALSLDLLKNVIVMFERALAFDFCFKLNTIVPFFFSACDEQ